MKTLFVGIAMFCFAFICGGVAIILSDHPTIDPLADLMLYCFFIIGFSSLIVMIAGLMRLDG